MEKMSFLNYLSEQQVQLDIINGDKIIAIYILLKIRCNYERRKYK